MKQYPSRTITHRNPDRHVAAYTTVVRAAQWLGYGAVRYLLIILSGLGTLARPLLAPMKRALYMWGTWHLQVIFSTIGQLIKSPLTSLMTGSVIGIALALPAVLYVLLENVQELSWGWTNTAQISIFLTTDKTDDDARAIAEVLNKHPALRRVEVITRSEALAEYQQLSGFKTLFDALDVGNPLPSVLVLYPVPAYANLDAMEQMVEELEEQDGVEIAQFDLQWLARLYTMMEIIQRGILGLAVLLALGVLLIVGNTIRLSIHNRREEIEIAKLFGASDAFIRRPFLYTGAWYGLLGGVIAWFVVSAFFGLLQGPIHRLAALYYTDFPPMLPGADILLLLVCTGVFLGISGSWAAVGRQLDAIEPS